MTIIVDYIDVANTLLLHPWAGCPGWSEAYPVGKNVQGALLLKLLRKLRTVGDASTQNTRREARICLGLGQCSMI